MTFDKPWVSFCMSTYKRPAFLRQQLQSLTGQIFKNFEVIVSDNDPHASGREVVSSIGDARFKYYHNVENLGMIKSFNKSIERSSADYIVMITDDDPVENNFLSDFYALFERNSSFGVYAGFIRSKKSLDEVEYLSKETFAAEILNINKTPKINWSSCIIEKTVANEIGKIPDFGSPHLADHAFMAMCGSVKGGVLINRMYTTRITHKTNFSNSNFDLYVTGCAGFYNTLINYFKMHPYLSDIKRAIDIHLKYWLLICMFGQKINYYKNRQVLHEIQVCARELLQLHFMKKFTAIYYFRNTIFYTKKLLGRYDIKRVITNLLGRYDVKSI